MLTTDLTDGIAAAGNKYRWAGNHRRPSTVRRGVRRGFFAGTAAGTGLVVAVIAFPMSAAQTDTAMFVPPPPSVSEPEADHQAAAADPLKDCPACVDPPPPPRSEEPTQAGPERSDPVVPAVIVQTVTEVRHRRVDPVVPISAPPVPPAQPTVPEPTIPDPPVKPETPPVDEEPVPPQAPAPTGQPTPEPTPDPTETTTPPDQPEDPTAEPEPPTMPPPTTDPADQDEPDQEDDTDDSDGGGGQPEVLALRVDQSDMDD